MLVAAVALMAVASAPDPTPTPARLAPAGKWVVDGELTECILARRFGTGDQQIILGFVPGIQRIIWRSGCACLSPFISPMGNRRR